MNTLILSISIPYSLSLLFLFYLYSSASYILFWRFSYPLNQLLLIWYQSTLSLSSMTETCAIAATNEAIASLRTTTDHHTKELQEMQTVQEIHTRTLNEMSQQLNMVLQKLSSLDQVSQGFQSQRIGENTNPSFGSTLLPVSRPMKLEFPRFFGEDLASWVYKANQYFRYSSTPIGEKLMLASFHMEGEALIWFEEGEETGVFSD